MDLLDNLIYFYNSITPFQATVSLSILLLYVLHLFLRDLHVPPGPRGLLYFGYWTFLQASKCHIQLLELAKKYGDVYSFRSTGRLFINLGSIKAIKEAHVTKSECFEGRCLDFSVTTHLLKDNLLFTNGEPWKVLRKFFVMKFKEYGMNDVRQNASCSVYDVLQDTIEELHSSKGRPIKVADLATTKCMLVIRRIIFNDEAITEAEFQELIDNYAELVNVFTSTNFLLLGNFARYFILPLMPSYWKASRSEKRISDILSMVVERRKIEYDEKCTSNLIDCYLKERDDRQKRGDPTAAHFSDRYLAGNLGQFVTDGVLTVGLVVGVFLQTLTERTDEQEKVYREIIDVIGPDRLPEAEDKSKLPYTTAFMYEVFRHSDFFPFFASMKCSKKTTLNGYKIPEGSITIVNIYAAHRNPDTYENPDEFNPSRFLSTPDKPRADLPVLFGVGKRSCIGEAFSMSQIFLFFTTVVQNFRLAYPEGSQGIDNKMWSKERVEICAYPRSPKSNDNVS